VYVLSLVTYLVQWKAEDVMRRFISRVKELQTSINVVVVARFEQALAEAMQLDTDLDADPDSDRWSEENMPFLGVPLSVKEAFAVKGLTF